MASCVEGPRPAPATPSVGAMAEAAAVHDMIRAFSEMDERHGGHHGRSAPTAAQEQDLDRELDRRLAQVTGR
ncbi:hypothetical protein ABZ070_20720 [Streptomyces sp. NPDC006283]|uniref:hypothetical protein n=1 Tax=Streptomyces sp. NPDC006283 TaxID=3156741 RepID=UPI0033A6A5D6